MLGDISADYQQLVGSRQMPRPPHPPGGRRFIGIPELRQRWGNCSQTLIETKIRTDPDFPDIYYMSRHRMVREDQVEIYERKKVVRTKANTASNR
jgi:hypothetical protein